jgi:ABC-2 type transport system ATP-binding protein
MMASLYPAPIAVDEALRLAGVGDLADRKVHRLSGGQTQRVRFAAVVVADPMLLVLDEPTVAMDVEARQEFWLAIHRFAGRGRTVVFATHYLEEADAAADRIVVLAGGRVVADGSATEIKSRVGARMIRATLPDVDIGLLARLSGVSHAERHGDSIILTAVDSDLVLRDVLGLFPECRDIEVRGAGLELVYVELTQPVGSPVGVAS